VGLLDDLKGKAQGLIRGNEQAIKDGINKAGDFVDSKTGGKYTSQVDQVQAGASTLVDKANERPTQGPADNVPPAEKAP
jgi:hypothetical protein